MKLLRAEAETEALDEFLRAQGQRVSSEILGVELACVCHRQGIPAREAEELLTGLRLLPIGRQVLRAAAERFEPPQRALDAIHLASALQMRLDFFVTYDTDQALAARARGLAVAQPA